MKVLMVEPGKIPHEADIEPGLRSLQAAVDGYIQAVYPYEDPVALICNEDGKFMGLPLNRALRDDAGEVYDIIAGNFLITGLGEESFSDLSPELMEKYKEWKNIRSNFWRRNRLRGSAVRSLPSSSRSPRRKIKRGHRSRPINPGRSFRKEAKDADSDTRPVCAGDPTGR